jgi:hypothetical protein
MNDLTSDAAAALYDKLLALQGEIGQEPDAQEGLWAEMVAVLRDADPHAVVALIFRGPPPRSGPPEVSP